MRQGLLFGAIAIFLAAFFIMTLFPPALYMNDDEVWLPVEEVRGSAVVRDNREYTLNFEQQKALVRYLNNAGKISPPIELDEEADPYFSEVIVYRFNADTMRFKPEINTNGILLLSYQHDGGAKAYLIDTSKGGLIELLRKASGGE